MDQSGASLGRWSARLQIRVTGDLIGEEVSQDVAPDRWFVCSDLPTETAFEPVLAQALGEPRLECDTRVSTDAGEV